MKKIYLFLSLPLLLPTLIQAAKISDDQCIANAKKLLGYSSYAGVINIGTQYWPDRIYGTFLLNSPWLYVGCNKRNQGNTGGCAYGGQMNINACQENPDNIIVKMSGNAINYANITIPKSDTTPVPSATVEVQAIQGIDPSYGKVEFTPNK